jgi:hypothetical protein
LLLLPLTAVRGTQTPTTPHTQPPPGITCARFSHPPRSLATTSGITICFLLLRVLRCFTSPRSPPHPIHSDAGDTTSLVPGYPIRTSSDPRSVDNSPRHIAASHVLHRLSMPRHPPCALTHLQTQKPKLNQKLHKRTHHQRQRIPLMLATTIHKSNTTPHHQARRQHQPLHRGPGVASGPNSVPAALLFGKEDLVVAHPVAATTAHDPFTAHTPPNAGCLSWCSLERR